MPSDPIAQTTLPAPFVADVRCAWVTLRKKGGAASWSLCQTCGARQVGEPGACPVEAMREGA